MIASMNKTVILQIMNNNYKNKNNYNFNQIKTLIKLMKLRIKLSKLIF